MAAWEGGGQRLEWEEAGPVTRDREGGTETWSKEVGQGQRDRYAERRTGRTWENRYPDIQRHPERNQDRHREMRGRDT